MDILKIKELCRTEQIEFSRHVSDRMFQRNITADEVVEAVYNGRLCHNKWLILTRNSV